VGSVALDAMRRAGYTLIDGSLVKLGGADAHVGVYRGQVSGVGKVRMRAAHIGIGRQVYVVAGFAPEAEFDQADRDFQPSINTFRQLSASEATQIRPNRLAFYTVKAGDSWQSIAQRAGKGITNASTLAIMNGHEVSDQPAAGDRVKIVVEG
jgi:predicted Zn-dependent protease